MHCYTRFFLTGCVAIAVFFVGAMSAHGMEKKLDQSMMDKKELKIDTRELSPGAQARDPHWRPGSSSGRSGTELCKPDLVVSAVKLERTSIGIVAKAQIGNLKSCALRQSATLWFESEGIPAIGGFPMVGPGFSDQVTGWSQGVVIPCSVADDASIQIRAVVDREDRVDETNERSNTCTATLAAGEESHTETCYGFILHYFVD